MSREMTVESLGVAETSKCAQTTDVTSTCAAHRQSVHVAAVSWHIVLILLVHSMYECRASLTVRMDLGQEMLSIVLLHCYVCARAASDEDRKACVSQY